MTNCQANKATSGASSRPGPAAGGSGCCSRGGEKVPKSPTVAHNLGVISPHQSSEAPQAQASDSASHADESSDDRRVQRRRQILETAKEVFAELGYHNASINEIIGRANIARGTFYLYFSNKHKVFDAILDEALGALRARITRIRVGDPAADPPETQLRQNLIRIFEYVLGDQPLTRLVLTHQQHPQTEVAERVDDFFRHVSALIESSLQHGIDMGLVRPCNTALVAAALLGAVRGMVSYCLEANPPPDVDSIVNEIISFSLRGVLRT